MFQSAKQTVLTSLLLRFIVGISGCAERQRRKGTFGNEVNNDK